MRRRAWGKMKPQALFVPWDVICLMAPTKVKGLEAKDTKDWGRQGQGHTGLPKKKRRAPTRA
jgi:hypothetical protein